MVRRLQEYLERATITVFGITPTIETQTSLRAWRRIVLTFAVPGFTLIELLVVIAIIALLSSIVLASLSSSKSKANDSQAVAGLKQIELALNLYALDHNGAYPATSGWYAGTTVCNGGYGSGHSYSGPTGYIPDLAPTYISVLPEVANLGPNKCFLYRSSGKDYKLLIWNAVANYNSSYSLVDRTGGSPPCNGSRANTYSVYSSSASECW
jgi:prepilin-type N-terminal cleavage/methylation domain-containing protein